MFADTLPLRLSSPSKNLHFGRKQIIHTRTLLRTSTEWRLTRRLSSYAVTRLDQTVTLAAIKRPTMLSRRNWVKKCGSSTGQMWRNGQLNCPLLWCSVSMCTPIILAESKRPYRIKQGIVKNMALLQFTVLLSMPTGILGCVWPFWRHTKMPIRMPMFPCASKPPFANVSNHLCKAMIIAAATTEQISKIISKVHCKGTLLL